MKFTVLSDTHRKHSQVPLDSGDVLIHAGDIGANNKENLINFLGWFQKQRFPHKIFVAGNHDGWMQHNPGKVKYIMNDYDVHYLQDEYVTINDIRIWGSPWAKEFGGWAFMKEEWEMEGYIDKIPHEIIDIFISHGPPLGILDEEKFGELCGSEALLRVKPDYFICGHIHECGGQTETFRNTNYINASVVNRQLDVVNDAITFEYE